ncbi:LD-carboxypeptidase [Spiroplasma gladiatoris]|uniref:LD-carboxypeptidase n=1 Tax=Spiroplasma gladiatoris TaxID=2143 RepID=A0A4P7AGN5_9MOLU|nr:S66 peptidase family protein [Spiroplasma gladiatoris]QBQ07297.1 LD-carboxypeptidase [Spiroplasma gladiatoris]
MKDKVNIYEKTIYPSKLNKDDAIAIVSLSSGILGEDFCNYQLNLGITRLEEIGLKPKFMSNSLKGEEFIKNNPEKRAQDLIDAFLDNEVKIIMSAIGGDDSYKIIEHLIEKDIETIIKNNPKIFIGYSDITNIHLLLNKFGLSTIYGHAFLTDIAEFDTKMLDYSYNSFLELFKSSKSYEITSAKVWYEERKSWKKSEIGTPRIHHIESTGYEFINFKDNIEGYLYGGCLESLYSILTGNRYLDQPKVFEKYNILLNNNELKETIFYLETSEAKHEPELFKLMLEKLVENQILQNIKCLIVGKPQDNIYYDEYKKVCISISDKYNIPIVLNLNFGHSYPKTIIPNLAKMSIDPQSKKIFVNKFLKD